MWRPSSQKSFLKFPWSTLKSLAKQDKKVRTPFLKRCLVKRKPTKLSFYSKERWAAPTSCPGGIWPRPPHRPAQSQRWAPLPQEADRDALPPHPAPEGYRLQVTDLCSLWLAIFSPPLLPSPPGRVLTAFVDKHHSHFLLLYLLAPLRSLTLLIREVLAGSVFLPSLDYLADPVSVDAFRSTLIFRFLTP